MSCTARSLSQLRLHRVDTSFKATDQRVDSTALIFKPVFHRIQSGSSWRTPAWRDRRSPAGRPDWFHSTSELCCTWRIVVVATRGSVSWGWYNSCRRRPRSWLRAADCDEDSRSCSQPATNLDRPSMQTPDGHTS